MRFSVLQQLSMYRRWTLYDVTVYLHGGYWDNQILGTADRVVIWQRSSTTYWVIYGMRYAAARDTTWMGRCGLRCESHDETCITLRMALQCNTRRTSDGQWSEPLVFAGV